MNFKMILWYNHKGSSAYLQNNPFVILYFYACMRQETFAHMDTKAVFLYKNSSSRAHKVFLINTGFDILSF